MCMLLLFLFRGSTLHKLNMLIHSFDCSKKWGEWGRKEIKKKHPWSAVEPKERTQAIDMVESLLGVGRKFHRRRPSRCRVGGGVSALLSISFCPKLPVGLSPISTCTTHRSWRDAAAAAAGLLRPLLPAAAISLLRGGLDWERCGLPTVCLVCIVAGHQGRKSQVDTCVVWSEEEREDVLAIGLNSSALYV